MKRVALAAAVVLAIGAPGASAHYDDNLAKSLPIARAAFPTACEPAIYPDHAVHGDYRTDPQALMWAASPALLPDHPYPCEIGMSEGVHNLSPARFCTDLVHEFGHLTGLQHSSDPTSVMYLQPPLYAPCLALEASRKWRRKHWRFGWVVSRRYQ